MSKAFLVAGAFAALLAACGDGTGVNALNLSGNWVYSTSNLASGGVTCNSSGTALTISQQGGTFSGSYNGGTISCFSSGGSFSGDVGSGTVVNGSLNGTGVSFDLDTGDWHNSGNVSGNSMSGTVTVRLVVNSSTVILTGSWAAARQ